MAAETEIEPLQSEMPVPPRVRSRMGGLLDQLCVRVLRHSALGCQMRMFGNRLEHNVFPAAREGASYEDDIAFSVDDEGLWVSIDCCEDPAVMGGLGRLCSLLSQVGVGSIELNTDLESNQVSDVLELLWCLRGTLSRGQPNWWDRQLERDRVLEALTSDGGMHVACADVTLEREARRLRIASSYCPLTFSRAVTAYKSKVSRFADHRAFFQLAPRAGLLATALAFLPPLVVMLFGAPMWMIVATGLTAAALVGIAAVVVFETIGAVEYDKEHQAKELRRRHEALVAAHGVIQADLARARRIQRRLIPDQDSQPAPDAVHFAHAFVPQMDVGGDYYDFAALEDGRVAIVFVDVSGHGMAGAFVTGIIKSAFDMGDRSELPPHEFVSEINQILDWYTPEDSFAAMISAVYDADRHVLQYTNAGHSPRPIVVRRDGTVEGLREADGLVVGVSPGNAYEQSEVELAAGDMLVLCTDGITESANEAREQFGLDRLKAVLTESAGRSAEGLPDKILKAVAEHSAGAPQADDQTILIMEVLQ